MQKETEPWVSVCMITYNHAPFIRQAVESVLMQKTGFPYVLIIGDDASTDGTTLVLEELAHKNPALIRLTVNSHNLGMIENFLSTLARCEGKYIALCEGDDYWTDKNKLQMQVDFLEQHNDFATCFHNCGEFYDDNSSPSFNYCPKTMSTTTYLEDLFRQNFISTSSVMWRKDNIEKIRIPEWFSEIISADWVFQMFNAEHGSIYYIDRVMSRHRHHAGGVSYNHERMYKDIIQIYGYLDEHFNKKYSNVFRKNISLQYLYLFYIVKKNKPEIAAINFLLRAFYYDPMGMFKLLFVTRINKLKKVVMFDRGK